MKILVTGGAGHLGEALMRLLGDTGHEAVGLDVLESPYTTHVGSITDAGVVREAMRGVDAVLHTATLHKPHVATHAMTRFVEVNVKGTLNVLEQAVALGVGKVVFTSSTTVFSRRCRPAAGEGAVWVTEELEPLPKNIYGVTKVSAERLCELFWHRFELPVAVLRTSRFFWEPDDDAEVRQRFGSLNSKVNELVYRRVDIGDAARAHLDALERVESIGFDRFIITATTPFTRDDLLELRTRAPEVLARTHDFEGSYAERGWSMPDGLDRVYVNQKARDVLGWRPKVDFAEALRRLDVGARPFGPLTYAVGSKPYHDRAFDAEEGPYPTDE